MIYLCIIRNHQLHSTIQHRDEIKGYVTSKEMAKKWMLDQVVNYNMRIDKFVDDKEKNILHIIEEDMAIYAKGIRGL